MWKGPPEDPAGPPGVQPEPPPSQELLELKEQFEQSQTLVAQLKEMLRKSEHTSVTQEKVAEYANTLTKMNARAKRGQKEGGSGPSKKGVESPASGKILLLRQQMEENKVKLAERGKSQKGMVEMVTQIKAQLDDSTLQLNQTPLNISLIEDRVEYSPNTSSQELYNILLNKDKRINDLNVKLSRLEANNLDLQENIKEKDSVIDARTKAITLMSENLSKKGKNTLDALDETKEQMRKMQENFILLEEEMKGNERRLLGELEEKNAKIHTLNLEIQNCDVERLHSRIEELELLNQTNVDYNLDAQILQLNKIIQDQQNTITHNQDLIKDKKKVIEAMEKMMESLKQERNEETAQLKLKLEESRIAGLKHADANVNLEIPEVTKLKQQLDESNKNMIKVKAQHKSKIKELNKKIDHFKKIGDVNAEVVKLEAENSKYSQKIAELEEEKGQLQLNMVDSKESINLDDVKAIETELKESKENINEKLKLIETLETRNQELQNEVSTLTEKVEQLSTLQNAQVKSDLSSIEYEEQLEKLESENKALQQEKDRVTEEIATLNEKFEALTKEKQELTVKLDTYMQENIDLIDRLEKLSAEKVSSAESIEIVENLTHQEKLELEAYQKHLVHKSTDNLAENPELNDSVNQLTEETSELLQKIELFTVERREVMEKMEALTAENAQLALKIREIENNRDVLVETYEQLQSEKEALETKLELAEENKAEVERKLADLQGQNSKLKDSIESETIQEFKSLIDIQKQEIQELKIQLISERNLNESTQMMETINSLENQYSTLLSENEKLKKTDSEETINKLNKRIVDFEDKLKENLEEIDNYKSILEENKGELIHSSNIIADLQENIKRKSDELEHYLNEIEHLNSVITDLNSAIEKLEEENEKNAQADEEFKLVSARLQDLKSTLNENLDQNSEYEKELENYSETIKNLNVEIKQLNNKIIAAEQSLEDKDKEINELKAERSEKDKLIKDLEHRVQEKDEAFHVKHEELKAKCLTLQSQIGKNTDSVVPLQNKVAELEKKNKEQLEKMKKIAANLKKKTSDYKVLETEKGALQNEQQNLKEEIARLKGENEKFLQDSKNLQVEKQSYYEELESLRNELKGNNSNEKYLEELSKLQNELANFNNERQIYLDRISELQNEKQNSLELRQELSDLNIKMLNQSSEISNQLNEIDALQRQAMNITAQIEDLQNINREYEGQMNSLINENELLRSNANNTSNIELSQKEEVIRRLQAEIHSLQQLNTNSNLKCEQMEAFYKEKLAEFDYNMKSQNDAHQMKTNELEMYIETLQGELKNYKEKVERLEEGLSKMEERRMSLEHKAIQLGSELQKKEESFEEISQNEDMLEQRLAALAQHDAHVQKNLEDIKLANQGLSEQNHHLQEQNCNFTKQIEALNEDLRQSLQRTTEFEGLDYQNSELKYAVNVLEAQVKELTGQINNYRVDRERSESEMQEQVEEFNNERRLLMEQLEIAKEEVNKMNNEIHTVKSKYQDLEAEYKDYIVSAEAEIYKKNEGAETMQVQANIGQVGEEVMQQSVDKALFTWPEAKDDPFAFIAQPSQDSNPPVEAVNPVIGNTQEELLNKIKTLEFMLYNVEKEKEAAVLQCHDLSAELTRLVYDKENRHLSELESQIMTGDEVEIPRVSSSSTSYPNLSRTVCQPLPSTSEEICEETMSSSKAFECYEDEDGWNPDDAKLEAEYMEKSLAGKKELEDELRVLRMERENHLEEIKQAQIKSGKYIKKLKEFKARNEELQRKLKLDSGGLDDAIQDELKSQVETLERRIKETSAELHKEKLEKDNLLKRVDVLTSANERLVELKEKQDVEVLGWKHQNQELSDKLMQMHWPVESSEVKEPVRVEPQKSTENTEELNEIIKELTLDNEELQTMLEEQRNLRIEAEKLKKGDSEFNEIIEERNKLSEELRVFKAQYEQTKHEIDEVLSSKQKLQEELGTAQEKIVEISQQLQTNYSEKTQMQAEILDNNITIDALNQQLQELNASFAYLKEHPANEGILVELKQKVDELQSEKHSNEELKLKIEEFSTVRHENEELRMRIAGLSVLQQENEEFRMRIASLSVLQQENEDLRMRIAGSSVDQQETEELRMLIASLSELQQENEELKQQIIEISVVESGNDELNIKRQELEDLRQFIEELNVERDNFIRQIEMLIIEKQNLSGISEDLKRKIEEFNVEKQHLNSIKLENEELKTKLEELNEVHIKVLSDINELNHTLHDLRAEKSKLEESNHHEECKVRMERALLEKDEEHNLKIQHLTEEWTGYVDQRGADVAESWKLHLESRENEFTQLEQQLRKEIFETEEKSNALVNENNELRKNVDADIKNEVDRISALQAQINDRQLQINNLKELLQKSQRDFEGESAQHLAMIAENGRVVQELTEKYEQAVKNSEMLQGTLSKLQLDLQERQNDYQESKLLGEDYKNQMEVLKVRLAELDGNLKEKDSKLTELTSKHNDNQSVQLQDYKNQMELLKVRVSELDGNLKEKEYKITELTCKLEDNQTVNKDILNLQLQIQDYQQQINNYNVQLQENYLHNETLMQEIENYKALTEHVQSKELEINNLKALLQEKEREYEYNLQSRTLESQSVITDQSQQIDILKRRLQDAEDSLDNYKQQVQTQEVEFKQAQEQEFEFKQDNYKQQLDELLGLRNQEIEYFNSLQAELADKNSKLNELEVIVNEDEKQMIELKAIIEEQVLKIEELKNESYEKSTNYDALVAELNIPKAEAQQEENLAEPVSRAELNLALYMLHQRDVRCEELTVELMQLLEERDTLQLRLSNAIREKEEIKSRITEDPDEKYATGAIPKTKQIILGATGTELAAEATEEGSLATKLSELKSVKYNKDKTIVDEQELRRMQQLSILQHHKDDVSKLPAEAAARLVDASYTLSRDVQSPSKVILNWLWGKSTPKVNNV